MSVNELVSDDHEILWCK